MLNGYDLLPWWELRILIHRQYIVDKCEMTAALYVLMKDILRKWPIMPMQL
jgi:hypothetical protein